MLPMPLIRHDDAGDDKGRDQNHNCPDDDERDHERAYYKSRAHCV